MTEIAEKLLDEYVLKGEIQLGRGNIISAKDVVKNPGIYPIYSSSAKGNGEFGKYGSYMFDEELITWSVDGGGRFFYRPKHKFSVTNVSGYMRVDPSKWNPRYVFYLLDLQHRNISFDYQTKAHPSIIRKLYTLNPLNLTEQNKIANILSTLDQAIEQTEAIIAKQERIKTGLMQDLLTKGIDENGNIRSEATHEFKDSPLGRIPVEWEVEKLSKFYAEPARNGLYKPKDFYGSGHKMIHMPQMFVGLTVNAASAIRVVVDRSELNRFGLQTHDLLIARRSLVLEGAGRCALVPQIHEPTTFESSIIRVRLNQEQLIAEFANFFLNSEAGYRMRLPFIRQVAVSGVSGEDVGQFLIPAPDTIEQKNIINYFNKLEVLVTETLVNLLKLKKQKTGLMHDLLTGKVRVTDIQNPTLTLESL